ncbi:polysaccharide lyase family 8 super-sandwich domain-containing protein [Phytoactinopolyspora endophytica]|uniref:polysaccharide lyase family 8 super-sandwich domain-containing protein n=1 Tax=Phytoactinopolyspora endophytica TaxID=1642495 RepID=UPI0013E9F972|nr:polysaccharide lyase family 8 super-sandwich domain-containing protein [Phytoactinopolyspora endophytica]
MQVHTRTELSRRTLLGLGAGLAAGVAAGTAGFSIFSPRVARAADEFELIRNRYVELLVGPADSDTSHPDIVRTIESMTEITDDLLAAVVHDPGRDRVFADEPLADITDSRPIQTTALNLASMAKSWAAAGSPYQHDEELGSAIVAGLQTLHDLQYNVDTLEFNSWYHFEIGAPRGILEAATIVGDILPDQLRADLSAAVAHFVPDPKYNYPPYDDRHKLATGSNRLYLCQNVLVAAALVDDAERIQLAAGGVPDAIALTTSENGVYFDGSLIAHNNVPYTGTYGRALVTSSSYVLAMLGGTQWDLDEAEVGPFRTSIVRTFVPWTSEAWTLPPVCGRAVGRANTNSAWLMGSILTLAEGAPAEMAREWQGYVKGWLQKATEVNYFALRPLSEALLAQQLLDSDVPALEEEPGPRLFPQMDRILARGDGWCFSLATASTRTRGFETQGGENLKAWHQGSGARYLHLESEQEQYNNWFPTIDPYRMPGTTIDSQPHGQSSGGRGGFAFVGGSQVGGHRADDGFYQHPAYAGWVQQLQGYESDMVAMLSWFFVGDGVVCLGTGISGGSADHHVETILENRAIKTDAMRHWYVNGAAVEESEQDGWRATVADVRTMTLPDTASYITLDGPRTVEFLRETRSGAWADLSDGRSTEVHTNEVHTAWLDHGIRPDGAAYAYLMLPLAGPDEATSRERDPGVEILRNDTTVQAVSARRSGFVSANFHEAATIEAGPMTISGRKETCVSTLRTGNRRMEIAMADASQSRDERRTVVTFPPGHRLDTVHADPTVEVSVDGNELTMVIDSSSSDGRSHHVEVEW